MKEFTRDLRLNEAMKRPPNIPFIGQAERTKYNGDLRLNRGRDGE